MSLSSAGAEAPLGQGRLSALAAFLALASFLALAAFALFPLAEAEADSLALGALCSGPEEGPKEGPKEGPWKVAYFEPGPYGDYLKNLLGLAQGLEGLGLVSSGIPPAKEAASGEAAWEWLSRNAGGGRLAFLPDGFYSAGWDEA